MKAHGYPFWGGARFVALTHPERGYTFAVPIEDFDKMRKSKRQKRFDLVPAGTIKTWDEDHIVRYIRLNRNGIQIPFHIEEGRVGYGKDRMPVFQLPMTRRRARARPKPLVRSPYRLRRRYDLRRRD